MGGSESRCCTDAPQEKNITEKTNCTENFDSDSPVKITKDLRFDPRSPSQDVERTPIEVQTKPLMRVQPMIENNLRNRYNANDCKDSVTEVVQCHNTFMVDPRSPGPSGSRTPVSSKHFSNLVTGNPKPSKLAYPEATLIDPRSPSQDIVRTPLLAEEVFYGDCVTDENDGISETPKKPHGAANLGYSTENDPRSPSQKIARTPTAKFEIPDHQTDLVSVKELHDPRSPTADVSRTPIGALFAGHRELRRTVLMTNALLASPLNKKLMRNENDVSATQTEDKTEFEFENPDSFDEDEIPAILCCNFDPLNNSCSSSMVASIGSEVDCISLDESIEGLISTTDTVDFGLMESLLKDTSGVALEEETKEQYDMFGSGYQKCDDIENPDTFYPALPENYATKEYDDAIDEDHQVQYVDCIDFESKLDNDQCPVDNYKQSLEGENLHEIDIKKFCKDSCIDEIPIISNSSVCDVQEKATNKEIEKTTSHIISEGSGSTFIHNDHEESQLNCVTEYDKPCANIEEDLLSEKEEKQIDEILSDLVSMADDAELINNSNKEMNTEDSNAKTEDTKKKKNLYEDPVNVQTHSADTFEEFRDIFAIDPPKGKSDQTPKEEVTNSKDPIDTSNKIEQIAELDSNKEIGNRQISLGIDDNNLQELITIELPSQEHAKEEKKASRKLRPPSTNINRKKLANYISSTEKDSSAVGIQVNQCASNRKASMMKRPKAKSASSDDGRTINKSVGQENMRSIKRPSTRKSDSKLLTPAVVRSPLTVLTNDINSPNTKGKFSYSPARSQTTKLPRYQGTPPLANTRSLSVSFSDRSTKRSQSGERQRRGQRSFSHDKEN